MQSLAQAARAVLETSDADAKAGAARAMAAAWRKGQLAWVFDVPAPDRPARPDAPVLLAPNHMPKRGRGGSARARIALLHALAHIELNAVDLACDMIVRFAQRAPRAFADDWVRVADEEGLHFSLLQQRLRDWGASYGDLPAHDGLWEAAMDTREDFIARLVVVPQVLEARGLDVTPAMIARFTAQADPESAAILERIYKDEIGHVRIGNFWFRWACQSHHLSPEQAFKEAVLHYFRGELKPPFNDLARSQAGLEPHYYHPLAKAHPPQP